MSLAAFKNIPFNILGSLLSRIRAEAIVKDFAVRAENIRYKLRGIITRPGLSQTLQLPFQGILTGGFVFNRFNTTSKNINRHPLFSVATPEEFRIYLERPDGSGSTELIAQRTVTDNIIRYIDFTQAYGRAYMAVGNLLNGVDSVAYQYDATNFDTVSIPPQTFVSPTLSSSVDPGNVEAGIRYCVVLFKTRNGYISGTRPIAIGAITLPDGTHRIGVSNIATTTGNLAYDVAIVGRVVCFTTANGDINGPYYYIPEDDTIDMGTVPITKTVIDNNVDTSAVFNFTDLYLQGSVDITSPVDFFDKIQLPPQASVFFSPSTRRLIWSGGIDDETIFRVSEPDDPETYLGTTGFIKPAENDGERAITAREFRAQLYLFKEHAGFLAYPDAVTPNQWTIEKRWDRVGPVGPWAVDISEQFMIFLDKSGVYHYEGGLPVNISDEISSFDSDWWKRINWCVKHRFWVMIDTDLNEIHVGVALDTAEFPTHILKCNYLNGFPKKKWSVDTIPCSKMIKVERFLPDLNQI